MTNAACSGLAIVGAGPAGLACAIGFGAPCTVLERRREVGGLCASAEIDGAVFDVGGHSFWTPHDEVRELVFGALDMFEQRRRAVCYAGGAWIDYPFQRNFSALPDPQVRAECAEGLAAADGGAGAAQFEEHILRRYGGGVARHFLLPYNRKLWARDLRRLATDWTQERVAAPVRAAEPLLGSPGRRPPLQEDTRVAYPAQGGFGEIARALARSVSTISTIRTEAEVVRIDPVARELALADGGRLRWERLVSTIPLPELLARIDGAPDELRASAGRLEYVSLRVVFAVVDRPPETETQRVYVAEPGILAHKVALNHNSSPALRARPHSAVIAEVSYSADKPLPAADIGPLVARDLAELGLVREPAQVRRTVSVDVRYAYPVPTPDRAARVREIAAWLEPLGIATLGRLGEWDYINSDECIRRGLAAGRAITAFA